MLICFQHCVFPAPTQTGRKKRYTTSGNDLWAVNINNILGFNHFIIIVLIALILFNYNLEDATNIVAQLDSSQCSRQFPCGSGEGDCDTDLDCKGYLICGVNNCVKEFPLNGTIWNWYDDCCTGKHL